MDQFFKELREIQKKERANSSLARVGNDFYKKTYRYIDKLKSSLVNNPFSNKHYLLRDVQRIATEICERREHKINDAAVMNIQRSYHLFKGKPKFDLVDTIPLNLTPEEEKLFFSLINTLKEHRQSILLDKLTDGLENDSIAVNSKSDLKNESSGSKTKSEVSDKEPMNDINDNSYSDESNNLNEENIPNKTKTKNDKVAIPELDRIKKAKIIKNESYESIDKQINKSSNPAPVGESIAIDYGNTNTPTKSKVFTKPKNEPAEFKSSTNVVNDVKTKLKDTKDIDKVIHNILDNEDDQFVELDDEAIMDDDSGLKDDSLNLSKIAKNKKVVNETILIFSEIKPIVGVDEKVYGPFYPQDIVVMPNLNANIIVRNKKGRLIKYKSR